MNSFEVASSKVKQITSHKGHVRMFIVAYAVWITLTSWMLWQPFPSPAITRDATGFGIDRVSGCEGEVYYPSGYDECVRNETDKSKIVSTLLRIVAVFLGPTILLFAFFCGATVYFWVQEGYSN